MREQPLRRAALSASRRDVQRGCADRRVALRQAAVAAPTAEQRLQRSNIALGRRDGRGARRHRSQQQPKVGCAALSVHRLALAPRGRVECGPAADSTDDFAPRLLPAACCVIARVDRPIRADELTHAIAATRSVVYLLLRQSEREE